MDLDQLVQYVKTGTESCATDFEKPDDDFISILFLVGDGGNLIVVPTDPQVSNSPELKEMWGYLIYPKMAREVQAKMFAFLSSAYTIEAKGDEEQAKLNKWMTENPGASLSENPHHSEIVFISAFDGEKTVLSRSEINRDGVVPPTIGKWVDSEEGTLLQSRLIGPLMAAIRDVHEGK